MDVAALDGCTALKLEGEKRRTAPTSKENARGNDANSKAGDSKNFVIAPPVMQSRNKNELAVFEELLGCSRHTSH